jgi:glycosyltransferase involved in cell wall biosynthesis
MRIAFDMTDLLFNSTGVYRYRLNMADSLIKLDSKNSIHFYYCYYWPFQKKAKKPLDEALPIKLLGLPSLEERLQKFSGLPLMHKTWQILDKKVITPINKRINHRIRLVASNGSDKTSSMHLMRAIDDIDIVHHSQEIFFKHRIAKNVITIHDLGPIVYPEFHTQMTGFIFKNMFEFAVECCDLIFVVSNFVREQIIHCSGIKKDRIKLIKCGIAESFKPVRNQSLLSQRLSKYGLEPFSYIFYLGTIEPRKNIDLLLKAFHHLPQRHKSVRLVIGGKYGWKNRQLSRNEKQINKNNRIIFTGFIPEEDLPFIMNGAIVFVYPSLYEGFGLPPLEAMACGTPVIASGEGGLSEVIGNAALRLDPYDSKNLVNLIDRVLNSKTLQVELKEKGLARAAFFSWKESASEMMSAYETLL